MKLNFQLYQQNNQQMSNSNQKVSYEHVQPSCGFGGFGQDFDFHSYSQGMAILGTGNQQPHHYPSSHLMNQQEAINHFGEGYVSSSLIVPSPFTFLQQEDHSFSNLDMHQESGSDFKKKCDGAMDATGPSMQIKGGQEESYPRM